MVDAQLKYVFIISRINNDLANTQNAKNLTMTITLIYNKTKINSD